MILTTTVGSYPTPDWLRALPSEQARLDATRVVFDIQRRAGIDLPTDGELYRFDVNHPDTNGMIDYFVGRLSGIHTGIGRRDTATFRAKPEMAFRGKPAVVVVGPVTEGVLNLPEDCARAASVAGGPFKFTLTSPYMLARTLLDNHYHDLSKLTLDIADALAAQIGDLLPGPWDRLHGQAPHPGPLPIGWGEGGPRPAPRVLHATDTSVSCSCVQVDEANIPGNPTD